MRIWIINHYAVPPNNPGGTRHFNFAKELIARGHQVTLIAANFNYLTLQKITQKVSNGKEDILDGVPFVWIPVPSYRGNSLARVWNMLVFAWRILFNKYLPKSRPDIIVASSPHLFAALSGEILSRRFRVPFVLEIRDLWPETLVALGRFSNKHPLIRLFAWIENYLYKRAKRIITLLPGAGEYLQQKSVFEDRILWLPNAVNLKDLPAVQPCNENKVLTVMYAGAHGVANDLDTVLDAAHYLQKNGWEQRIQIHLIGEGPEKERLIQRVRDEEIRIVHFQAAVPKHEIYEVLQKADVFLMLLKDSPLFRWGISPNKLFDFLSMQRPVIFSVSTPFNPVSQAQAGITIKPSNPVLLAEAIIQLAEIPVKERQQMADRGCAYVEKHHDISKLTESLERLLYNTINETQQDSVKSLI